MSTPAATPATVTPPAVAAFRALLAKLTQGLACIQSALVGGRPGGWMVTPAGGAHRDLEVNL